MTPQVRHSAMLSERVGDDTIVYDTATHAAHRLNAVAATVWRLADGTRTVEDLVQALRLEGVDAADETLVLAAIDSLSEAGLLASEAAPEPERLNRREALAKAATVLLPLVASIVVPTPAQADSDTGGGTQPSPSGCPVTVSPTAVTVPSAGGSGTLTVTQPSGNCSWSAAGTAAWLTLTNASGSGNGSFGWRAEPNTASGSRQATVTVKNGSGSSEGGTTFTQEGRSCTQYNGTYEGTSVRRPTSPSSCPPNFFVDSFLAQTILDINGSCGGTITHKGVTKDYDHAYPIERIEWLSDGSMVIYSGSKSWVISGYPFTGQVVATAISTGAGVTVKTSESLSSSYLMCTNYWDMTGTKK